MFVDASAIVAILSRERDANALADALEQCIVAHHLAVFEATLGICRKRHASADEDVREFLKIAGVRVVSITYREPGTALVAFSQYRDGRGHPAQLNLGDCFACAMAKNHRLALLFDFDKTGIQPAALFH